MRATDMVRELLREQQWTQAKLAKRIGVSQATVHRWLRGVEPEGANRDSIRAVYEAQYGPQTQPRVRLMGQVGAGQAVYPLGDTEIDMVEAPPDAKPSTVAVAISGDSMLPWFEDRWLVYYSRRLPPNELIGQRVVAQLADGRLLLKTLRRGSAPHFWTLTSPNAADIEDIAVEWAAPIDWIKPR